MLPDLERLIHLQDLELRVAAANRVVAAVPQRLATLDAKLSAARAGVETAKAAIAENQAQRRTVDKDLAAALQRLEKYKDQSMAVKTNHEFHAMQHQMEAVKADIDQLENRVLEVMMGADELAAALRQAEATLRSDETAVAAERAAIQAERIENEAVAAACSAERQTLVAHMSPAVVSTFQKVARARGGVGLARAEKERCIVCQVRLRPMVYSQVVRSDEILQCDSCQRILYYLPPTPDEPTASSGPSQPPPAGA